MTVFIRDFFRAAICGRSVLLDQLINCPPTFESTFEWIKDLHAHQWDDAFDAPYYTHPLGAADIFKTINPDATEEEVLAVLLHDSKEDAGVKDEDLRRRNYTERTIWLVDRLTKERPKIFTYPERIQNIIDTGDRGLIYAKLSDNLHNKTRLMTGRLAIQDPERYVKLERQYTEAIQMMCDALDIDPIEVLEAIMPETHYSDIPGFDRI